MQHLTRTISLIIFIILLSNYLHAVTSDEVIIKSLDFETSKIEDKTYDPIEPVNRAIFSFNNAFDNLISEPASKEYKKLPPSLKAGVSNFIINLKMPLVFVNQLLQGQGKNASESAGRFLINSTIGVFGLIDVANKIGLEKKNEDFGQTLATWGVGDGFYLVLPFFGPSTLRDSVGIFLTLTTDPINTYAVSEGEDWVGPSRTAGNAIVERSEIIDEVNALRSNSFGYYAVVRSTYYQKRNDEIKNINVKTLTLIDK